MSLLAEVFKQKALKYGRRDSTIDRSRDTGKSGGESFPDFPRSHLSLFEEYDCCQVAAIET